MNEQNRSIQCDIIQDKNILRIREKSKKLIRDLRDAEINEIIKWNLEKCHKLMQQTQD
jgi:hypothetical protein